LQARGKLFETFLRELFNRQSIKMGDNFCLRGEEIDGTFKFEGENYIVEAKRQEASVSTSQLYHFAYKVDGKMHGLFISVNAFSRDGIEAIVRGKQIQTILMDGEDLSYVLEERVTLEALLDYKIRAAQTRGDVYVCALRQASKL
jgi:restriction endonuclease Mrr